jgi:hypothetical protein
MHNPAGARQYEKGFGTELAISTRTELDPGDSI